MKAILIDDEPLALDFLERQLRKISDISIVHKFVDFNIEKDAELIKEIDVIFLDIQMPGMNGIQLAENNTLRLNVCRELSFEVTKNNPEIAQWRTTKAQELFLYLLLHRGKTVRKSELADLLWPVVDFNNDYSQLYTAIYHVRQTLNKFSNYISLKNIGEGYHLSINNVTIDIVEWEDSIEAAPPISEKTIAEYELIMELYTGAYLQEYDYIWAESERYRLEMIWLRIAHQIASFYLQHDDLENAETWYSKICDLKPEDEGSHFSLMKIYDHLGYGLLVNHQYGQLKAALKEFDIQVSPHVQKWFDQWTQNK